MGAGRSSGSSLWLKLCVIGPIAIVIWYRLSPGCSCANKAIQSEAKTYIGSISRAQQTYYLSQNKFITKGSDWDKLGLAVTQETHNFRYVISKLNLPNEVVSPNESSNLKQKAAISIAVTKQHYIKSYVSIVWTTSMINPESNASEPTTETILCEAEKPGETEFLKPIAPTETTKPDFWSSLFNQHNQPTSTVAKTGAYQASTPILPALGETRSVSFDKDKNGKLQAFCPQGFQKSP
jgi:type IV pilus assembly protein PilA